MEAHIIIGIILFAASFLQGVTGFGSALIALPLLCLVVDIKFAIPLTVLCSLIITLYLAFTLKSYLDKNKLIPLCLAALPGIIFGTTLLKRIDSATIALLLGTLIICYGIYNLLITPSPQGLRNGWAYFAGFSSGAIGSAFSAGGPPVIIYTTMTDWDKNTIKATLTVFFLFNSIMIVLAHWLTGVTTPAVFRSFLISCPFILAGTSFGSYCYRFLRRKAYLKSMYILLIVMGIMMITLNA